MNTRVRALLLAVGLAASTLGAQAQLVKKKAVLKEPVLRKEVASLPEQQRTDADSIMSWYRAQLGTLQDPAQKRQFTLEFMEVLRLEQKDALARRELPGQTAILKPDVRAELYTRLAADPDVVSEDLSWRVQSQHAGDLYKQGNRDAAIDLMRAIDHPSNQSMSAVDRSRVQFNLATALVESRKGEDAVDRYIASWNSDPGFTPALEAAAEASFGSVHEPWARRSLARVVEEAARGGELDLAQRTMERCLALPDSVYGGELEGLPSAFARYLTRARVGDSEFQRVWGEKSRNAALSQAAFEDIGRCYETLQVFTKRSEFEAHFPHAAADPELRAAVEALLETQGLELLKSGNNSRALAQFTAAWSSDPSNPRRALHVVDTIAGMVEDIGSTERAALDRIMRVQRRIIDELFVQKGDAYREEDFRSILSYHTVLGTMFERMGDRWGPESNPRTAAFQWRAAIRTHARMRKEGIRVEPVPGAHRGLARAHAEMGSHQRAFREYIAAAEGFHALESAYMVREMVAAAEALNYTPTSRQRQILDRLRQ